MPYGDLTGPSNPSHEIKFDTTAANHPIYFTCTAQSQDAADADLDQAVQDFVDLMATSNSRFIFRSASKSGTYMQAITPTP